MVHVNIYGSWWWEVISSNKYDLTLAISAVIFSILWYRWKFSSSSDGAPSLPPGPLSLPIVGYLPFLGHELHKQFTHMARNYGPIFKLHVGSKLYVVINTSELAKAVLRDQNHIFSNRNPTVAATIVTYGGQDLVWSNNNSYSRNLRKIFVQEVLSNKNLQACSSFRKDSVRETIKNLNDSKGTTVNISEIAFLTEANVITNMVWENTSVEAAKDRHLGAELQMVVSAIIELIGKPNISDIFPCLAWFDLQGVERGMKKQLEKLDQIFKMIIDDRIKSNSKKSQAAVEKDRKKDFLQILLELKDQNHATSLNITQIKDVMSGGTETTTTLIEWAMTEIMQNRNVMKRIHEELVQVVGINNVVEESHLPKLQYLDATVKETFRLHPVVPFLIPHSPNETCTVGGYTIPKGCTIFLNLWAIHRDPRYWDNPLEFNPERFLTHLGKQNCDLKGNDLNFFPFGSGRRVCPGIPLAEKMQMYILASLLHSFNWNLARGEEHDLSDSFGITLKKKKPLIAIPSQRLPNESLYM